MSKEKSKMICSKCGKPIDNGQKHYQIGKKRFCSFLCAKTEPPPPEDVEMFEAMFELNQQELDNSKNEL